MIHEPSICCAAAAASKLFGHRHEGCHGLDPGRREVGERRVVEAAAPPVVRWHFGGPGREGAAHLAPVHRKRDPFGDERCVLLGAERDAVPVLILESRNCVVDRAGVGGDLPRVNIQREAVQPEVALRGVKGVGAARSAGRGGIKAGGVERVDAQRRLRDGRRGLRVLEILLRRQKSAVRRVRRRDGRFVASQRRVDVGGQRGVRGVEPGLRGAHVGGGGRGRRGRAALGDGGEVDRRLLYLHLQRR